MTERSLGVTPGVKSVYLARRHPSLSRADFVPRWRAHGELAIGLGGWRFAGRYTHGDVLAAGGLAGGIRLATEEYFGVGMVWFPGGEEALRQLVEDPEFPRLYADELEAFGGHVDDLTLLTRESACGTSGSRWAPAWSPSCGARRANGPRSSGSAAGSGSGATTRRCCATRRVARSGRAPTRGRAAATASRTTPRRRC